MCRIFVNTDPILYESRSRSVRIHGMVTSIRLENLFWNVLADIAADQGMTTNRLIMTLYDEVVEAHGKVQNLASFLRVSCVRYMEAGPGAAAAPVDVDEDTAMRHDDPPSSSVHRLRPPRRAAAPRSG
ncbi:ribbon-helix-helix domain-containing protein [Azospirillum sp. RWY-5-1]|uniref:Ribbon-helix-helix domain-containing protein n=1 Tax=Azospirillum oleiclasticum TaxID=2735135 RepID=A0ABX2TC51_9PROT|nr:ribbon-helix-helix domain-containing protein [Azospirillum oleiclasticum]NYZ13902.1 ribbon-helix-helix domain-containing protein [Azospirillum oleiclasticum]NYZ20826.1 ribbon-helix-helix domain-containing protein [Azospirillum oleiclasticum]